MPEKKLNLLQLAAGGAAEPSAISPEIVRREGRDPLTKWAMLQNALGDGSKGYGTRPGRAPTFPRVHPRLSPPE